MEDDQNIFSASRSNRLWLIISLVVVVTIVAVILVPETEQKAKDIPLPIVVPETSARPTQAQDPTPEKPAEAQPVAEKPSFAAAQSGGAAARAYLAEAAGATADELYARARQFQSRGMLEDAWLLYFKAAREGHADAAMALAEQADPLYFEAGKSVLANPDVVQAHKWYRQAQRNGSQQAAQRLQHLLTILEKSAQAGDEQAAVLLEKWK